MIRYLELRERVTPFPDGSQLRHLEYTTTDGAKFDYWFSRQSSSHEWQLWETNYRPGAPND